MSHGYSWPIWIYIFRGLHGESFSSEAVYQRSYESGSPMFKQLRNIVKLKEQAGTTINRDF